MCESGFVLTKFEFLFLIDWLIEMMKLFWFDWFEKCMKLLQDVNLILTKILQQFTLKSGSNWNELFSLWFVICVLSLYLYFNFNLNVMNYLLTETYFKIQRQRIDTRNSFKLSSETCWIDENVLEERSSTTSCILSSFSHHLFDYISLFVFVCDWFDSTLISFLLNTKLTLKWIEKTFERFDLICLSFTQIHFFLKHTFRVLKRFVRCWNIELSKISKNSNIHISFNWYTRFSLVLNCLFDSFFSNLSDQIKLKIFNTLSFISQKIVKCLCIFEFVLFVKLFKETWLSNTQNSREIKLNLNQTRNQNALSIFWYPNFEWMCWDMTLSGSI
jgi:hypothetical protein